MPTTYMHAKLQNDDMPYRIDDYLTYQNL